MTKIFNNQNSITRKKYFLSSLFFVFGLVLYLSFPSINYELNGIVEAAKVDAGGEDLFNSNHLLYRPLGKLTIQILQNYSIYSGFSLFVLQRINAIVAASGIAFGFLAFFHLSQSLKYSALAAIGMSISWSYWRYATEASYITVAAPFVAITIFFFLLTIQTTEKKRGAYALICGLTCAGAILAWQANIFLWCGLVVGFILLFDPAKHTFRRYIVTVLLALGTASVITGLIYVATAIITLEARSLSDFANWIFSNSSNGTTHIWGCWGIDRFPNLAKAQVASLIPLWEGLGLRELIRGTIIPAKIIGQISLFSLIVLLIGTLFFATRYFQNKQENNQLLYWLILSFLIYMPFILWWDPADPLWFVVLNIFFWGLVALVWNVTGTPQSLYSISILTAIVVSIGIANFTQTIWPHHAQPNTLLARAECVSNQMTQKDLFLATDWDWPGYVTYFYGHRVVSLIGLAGDPENIIEYIKQTITTVHKEGGHIIMIDTDVYPTGYMIFIKESTGFGTNHFDRLIVSPLFTCDNINFVSVDNVK